MANDEINYNSITLLNLFENPVIFDYIITYLPLQSISRLSQLSRSFRDFIACTPEIYKYLDLSKSTKAHISADIAPIDNGANTWRAERMDENLTEDEFYAGPLTGVLTSLQRKSIAPCVRVLVLDELAAVTNDLIADIVMGTEWDIRILSIRKCINVNQRRLQQFLKYICRPGRPEGTPRLQGIYIFTKPATSSAFQKAITSSDGVMATDGATLGALPVDKSRVHGDFHSWYSPIGQVISTGHNERTPWEETLMMCKGIIAFDAVLCTHMHEAMSGYLHDASRDKLSIGRPGISTMATMALGPEGCSGCGEAPVGSPVWGENDIFDFPLLWPPPRSGRIVDAVRPPNRWVKDRSDRFARSPAKQRLIVSCIFCLANRHCDSCHRWWCGDCYNPKKSKKLKDLEALSTAGLSDYLPSRDELRVDGNGQGDSVKVFNGFCVEDCLVSEMMSGAGSLGMWA